MSISKRGIFLGFIAAIFLALFISPFASQWPDGLEKIAQDKGFLWRGEGRPLFHSLIPDYIWPGIKNEKLATSTAGVLGTLIVFGLGYIIARLLKKGRVK